MAAARARDELRLGGAIEEFAGRLEALEEALKAAAKAAQWRQKACEEMDEAAEHCQAARGLLDRGL